MKLKKITKKIIILMITCMLAVGYTESNLQPEVHAKSETGQTVARQTKSAEATGSQSETGQVSEPSVDVAETGQDTASDSETEATAPSEEQPVSEEETPAPPVLTPQQKLDKGTWKEKKAHIYHYNINGKKTTGFVTIKGKKYFFDSKGIQRTGWRKIKGSYYFFRIKNKAGGYMVSSKTINGVQLSKSGKAKESSSVIKRKLTLMTAIAKEMDKITNCRMTTLEKMRKGYDYEIRRFTIRGSQTFYYDKNWDVTYAERIHRDGHGACFEFGALYAYYANAAGAKKASAVSSGGHGWAEVNGRVFDPNWEKGTGRDYFNMDYSLSGVGGRPNYARSRKYVKRV